MKTIQSIRYKFALLLMRFAIKVVIPDEYTRSRMMIGMSFTANLINQEIRQLEEEENNEQTADN